MTEQRRGGSVPPTIIYKNASNWVDRGEPANRTLRRVLSRVFDRLAPEDAPWLEEHALTIIGMVAADATEVHIASYLQSVLEAEHASPERGADARLVGIALWHIAKAALVRDFAERVLQGEVPVNEPTPDTLGHWLAGRLLTPEELDRFERDH